MLVLTGETAGIDCLMNTTGYSKMGKKEKAVLYVYSRVLYVVIIQMCMSFKCILYIGNIQIIKILYIFDV